MPPRTHDGPASDPRNLRGLRQALFVCDCLCNGDPFEKIVAKFKGDEQLVMMWINFLKHNHWVAYDTQGQRWHKLDKAMRHSDLESEIA